MRVNDIMCNTNNDDNDNNHSNTSNNTYATTNDSSNTISIHIVNNISLSERQHYLPISSLYD